MINERITSVTLKSLDRPDLGQIYFSLYSSGVFILEAMDGWSSINSINTEVTPFALRDGSSVSDPNQISGKIVTLLVHITGETETETIKAINTLNGILRTKMALTVVDGGTEFELNPINMTAGSYSLKRIAPTLYTLEVGLAAQSAFKVTTEIFTKVISGGGEVISGGIIYPTFEQHRDMVAYDPLNRAVNTITSVQENRIVIEGSGDVFPYFEIDGNFYSVKITHINANGVERVIELHAIGGETDSPHNWWIDNESLDYGFTTPNYSGSPNWNDNPVIVTAEWFILNVGENIIKAEFNEGGSGTVKATWRERYL